MKIIAICEMISKPIKMGFKIPPELEDKTKWLMYRLDQDVSSLSSKNHIILIYWF